MIKSKDDEVRNSILEAANRVFQKWGLNKTTMEDIAHEAGKGKSTLYYYYKSKDEILEVLAQTELSNIIQKANLAAADIKSSKDKLKKYIATMLVEIKKTVSIHPLAKGEIKGNPEFISRITKMLNDKTEAIIINILQEGFEKGEFTFLKKTEIEKAAGVIVGIISGLCTHLFFDNEDVEMIDIATRLITEGI